MLATQANPFAYNPQKTIGTILAPEFIYSVCLSVCKWKAVDNLA